MDPIVEGSEDSGATETDDSKEVGLALAAHSTASLYDGTTWPLRVWLTFKFSSIWPSGLSHRYMVQHQSFWRAKSRQRDRKTMNELEVQVPPWPKEWKLWDSSFHIYKKRDEPHTCGSFSSSSTKYLGAVRRHLLYVHNPNKVSVLSPRLMYILHSPLYLLHISIRF